MTGRWHSVRAAVSTIEADAGYAGEAVPREFDHEAGEGGVKEVTGGENPAKTNRDYSSMQQFDILPALTTETIATSLVAQGELR